MSMRLQFIEYVRLSHQTSDTTKLNLCQRLKQLPDMDTVNPDACES